MAFYILNTNLERVTILDSYKSMIWTDRYFEAGEFELYISRNEPIYSHLIVGNYIENTDSGYTMVIESYEFPDDEEDRSMVILRGRSLESILDRRVYPRSSGPLQSEDVGKFQGMVKSVITEVFGLDAEKGGEIQTLDLVIDDDLSVSKKVSNFVFEYNPDTYVSSKRYEEDRDIFGESVYDWLVAWCQYYSIGFRIRTSSTGELIFSLYHGSDRTKNQHDRPTILFSDKLDNLSSYRYVFDQSGKKNVAIVKSEVGGQPWDYFVVEVVYDADGDVSGLNRREMFVDGSSLSRTKENGTKYTETEYYNILWNYGFQKLIENRLDTKEIVDVEIDINAPRTYGNDFFLGDLISVDLGDVVYYDFRIIEVTTSYTADEITRYCTLLNGDDSADLVDDAETGPMPGIPDP